VGYNDIFTKLNKDKCKTENRNQDITEELKVQPVVEKINDYKNK
jgi:hypothetical protein